MAFRTGSGAGSEVGALIGIPSVTDLRAEPLLPDKVVILESYTAGGPPDQGLFLASFDNVADNGVTRFNPGAITGPGWERIVSTAISVKWAGAVGDGITDDSTAIQRAIDALSPNGGEVFFPRGLYRCLSAIIPRENRTLIGEGQTYVQGFVDSPTTLLDDRANPTTPFIYYTPNNMTGATARSCGIRDMTIDMPATTRTAPGIKIEAPGVVFHNIQFRGPATPTAVAELVRIEPSEQISFEYCQFLYGDNEVVIAGASTNNITFRSCQFYDCQGYMLSVAAGGLFALELDSCFFDWVVLDASAHDFGVIVNALGFTIHDCSFSGYTNKTPQRFLKLTGTGTCSGNCFRTQQIATTVLGATVEYSGNYHFADWGLEIQNGVVTGKSNFYQATDGALGALLAFKAAVLIDHPYVGAVAVELGPDQVVSAGPNPYTWSYYAGTPGVASAWDAVGGVVHYSPLAVTPPVHLDGRVRLNNLVPTVRNLADGTVLTNIQSGNIITHEQYVSFGRYKLPPAQYGLEFSFEMRPDQATPSITSPIVVAASGIDRIFIPGAPNGASGITNQDTNAFGHKIVLRCLDWYDSNTGLVTLRWEVVSMTGTGWTAPETFSSLTLDLDPDFSALGVIASLPNRGLQGGSFTAAGTAQPNCVFSNDANGHNVLDFDGINDVMTSTLQYLNITGLTDFATFAVVEIDAIATNAALVYDNDAVWSGGNEFVAMHLKSGTPSLNMFTFDVAANDSQVATVIGGYLLLQGRLDSVAAKLFARSGSAAENAGVASLNIQNTAGTMVLGRNYTTKFFNGRLARLMIMKANLTAAQITVARATLGATYGITV